MKIARWLAAALLAGALAVACSDDDNDIDSGPIIDGANVDVSHIDAGPTIDAATPD